MKNRFPLAAAVSPMLALFLLLQPLDGLAQGEKKPAGQEPATPARAQTVDPVFPEENKDLIFLEGEEAVSTNFSKEPILNYSASGSRTLQLNRSTGLQEGRAFYAIYVFYVEEQGTYELWYAGTPPGPKDDLYASYSSPFSYRLDAGESRSVYREDMAVVEQYSPSYYWNRVGELELAAGEHTLQFSVAEKRRYDNRYHFYLDCFFLLRKAAARGQEGRGAPASAEQEAGTAAQAAVPSGQAAGGPLPRVFPRNLANRSIDFPFRAIEDYQIAIRDRPAAVEPYVEIAQIYSLLGDYLNALKYLRRAELLEPQNRDVQLLIAKNRIWKGDVAEGLKAYRGLLLQDPKRLDLWLEAGKVAAWVGKYEESMAFYQSALVQYPDELALIVNLGLTYLWSGRGDEAERQFKKAAEKAQADVGQLMELAEVYYVNGYPQRALEVLSAGLKRFPDRLAIYLYLEKIYAAGDERTKAEEVRRLIESSFTPSPQLSRYLEIFYRKQSLRDEVIEGYTAQLARQPDNLELREVLAQTYFWNGERKKAIAEYLNLLANHAFQHLRGLDWDATGLLELIDRSRLYESFLATLPSRAKAFKGELAAGSTAYDYALKENQQFQAKVKAAREKGQTPPAVTGEDPLDLLKRTEQELGTSVQRASGYIDLVDRMREDWRRRIFRLEQIKAQDGQEEEAFSKLLKGIRWEWNRRQFIQELGEMNNVLADYSLAKVYLVERRLSAAQVLFEETQAENKPPENYYGLFQALLWQGKIREAFAVLDQQEVELASRVLYLGPLKALRASFEVQEGEAAESAFSVDEQAAGRALADLDRIEADSLKWKKELQAGQAVMHSLLERRLVRTAYRLEQDTYLLRNELGDYYLKEQNLPAAVRQFQQVLAVDPWNIDAVFRLGKVYELKRDWKRAMDLYRRVYFIDPQHENVTGQYNQLAREHADALEFSAHTLADTTRLIVHGGASYSAQMSSLLGLSLAYQADSTRIYKPVAPEAASGYLVQDLSLSLPLSLYSGKVTIAPLLGAYFLNELYSEQTVSDPNLPSPVLVLDYLGLGVIEPHAGLELSAALGPYLNLNGGYRFGRKVETFAPQRPKVFSNSGELNLNTDLSFIKAWPFENSSLRTYGLVEALTDGNLLYTAVQEVALGVLRLQKPGLRLDLLGNFLFQDSLGVEKLEENLYYYTPIGVLLAGGGLRGSGWFAVGEGTGLSVGLRASAGSYQERIFTPSELIQRVQLEAEANLGLSIGEATYSFRALFSTTYRYSVGGLPAGLWDYWSLYLALGYSARLPRLLAP